MNNTNRLDIIKLNIYEAFDNDEITYGEKEYLLEFLDEVFDGISRASKFVVKTGVYNRLGYLIGKNVGIDKLREEYDKEHIDELNRCKRSSNPEYIKQYYKKRDIVINKLRKERAKKGAKIGTATSILTSAIDPYD